MFRFADDGSLDTVLICAICGENKRYNFADSSFDSYEAFVEWTYEDASESHEVTECYAAKYAKYRAQGYKNWRDGKRT